MLIVRDDIILSRVKSQDIELIRGWRNSDEVKPYMEYRHEISSQQQQTWFHKINNRYNLFFLINVNKEPIGLIFGEGINWEQNVVSNAGIFIASNIHRENQFALLASILVNDFAFYIGIQKIFAKILNDNPSAKAYNSLIGYKLLPDQDLNYNQQYRLCKEDYEQSRKNLSERIGLRTEFTVLLQNETLSIDFLNVDLTARSIIKKSIIE
jgi:RimJ/RimL family protein N-acetyltransferase